MSWTGIEREAARLKATALCELFARDAGRVGAFTLTAPHLTLDLSRQRIEAGAMAALKAFAEAREVAAWRDRMFAGDIVNTTENHAALHPALRAGDRPEVAAVRARTRALADAIARRELIGAAGAPIEHVLHIGIGGSDLGPRLVADALKPQRRAGVKLRFAANLDAADIEDAIADLDPRRTLVIIVSKTFTTQETLANAARAKAWIAAAVTDIGAHFAAVTAAPGRAAQWGVAEERVFPFWDWVGGRYSLWSAVGLACEIALKSGVFERLLAGAAAMDAHFRDAPFEANAPLVAACVQFWNCEALGRSSYAIVPYARRLELLPAYLQQLEMESTGKRVDRDGRALPRPAAPVTWGAAGTNAQHSFFQMLHQGVMEIPVEFVLVADAGGASRAALLGNALAQAQALMLGKTEEEAIAQMRAEGLDEAEARRLAPHRVFPGDRASTTLALDTLSPESLGALLAFYEHRTAAQGFLTGVNPFDQWGVELGKVMAKSMSAALDGTAPPPTDPAAAAWVARLRR